MMLNMAYTSSNGGCIGSASSDDTRKSMMLLVETLQKQNQLIANHDHEMLQAIESMERLRHNWQQAEEENERNELTYGQLRSQIEEKDSRINMLEAQVKDARSQIVLQMDMNNMLRKEKEALGADLEENERRLQIVKQYIKPVLEHVSREARSELAFLRESAIVRTNSQRVAARHRQIAPDYMEEETPESENIDYDKTEDDLDMDDEDEAQAPAKRRSSAIDRPQLAKRSRLYATNTVSLTNVEEVDPLPKRKWQEVKTPGEAQETPIMNGEDRTSRTRRTIRRSMNRSMSESNLLAEKHREPLPPTSYLSPQVRTTSTMDLRNTIRTPGGSSWTNGRPISDRRHVFKRMPSTFKLSHCDVCNKGINFAARPAVCCSDCLQQTHDKCAPKLALPCVPRQMTPTPKKKGNNAYKLKDFCTNKVPMIPYPIIHCLVALEKRGLDREGLYRVPGNKSQADMLLNELRTSRTIPKLDLQDTEVITTCLKQFLRDLVDPVIPKSSREEFIRAARDGNQMALNTAISEMPVPNRDTLAYLCLHLQKVAEQSTLNKMPIENLGRCLGPAIVGTSVYGRGDEALAAKEVNEREKVVVELLRMSPEYWQGFLQNPVAPTNAFTPTRGVGYTQPSARHQLQFESPGAVDRSMLGPVRHDYTEAPPLVRPIAQRPKKFFDSPK